MKNNGFASVLVAAFFLSSCVNSAHINRFATAAAATLSSKSDIGYSFYQSCVDFDCQPEPTTLELQLRLPEKACNCDTFLLADKTLLTLNEILSGYLTALAQLSDGTRPAYDYTNLASAIDADAVRGKLNITSEQVQAASKLATAFTNNAMNGYRKKKLQDVIKTTNAAFQQVSNAYIAGLRDYLRDVVIENSLLRLKNNYSTYLALNKAVLSSDSKLKLIAEYGEKKDNLQQLKQLATAYVQALEKIKAGHQALFNEAGHLNEAAAVASLLGYASEIYSLNETFHALRKQKPLN